MGSYKHTNKYVQKYMLKMYVQNICNKQINAGKQLGMFLEQILLLFSFQIITVDHITVADQVIMFLTSILSTVNHKW